jgi:hypothetical protein
MANNLTFQFNGIRLQPQDDSLFALNTLYEMAGRPENKEPAQWKRLPQTEKLVAQIAKELNMDKSHILKSKRGKGGGSFAHWKLAMDYAGYLSVELRSAYYDWIRQFLEEEANPDLKIKRAIDKYRKAGKSEDWISKRVEGIQKRYKFTDTLQQHGVNQGWQYGVCTDEINKPVLGGKATELKAIRGLTKNQPLRDTLDDVELSAIGLAEAIAAKRIRQEQRQGFKPCRDACTDAGNRVKRVFD